MAILPQQRSPFGVYTRSPFGVRGFMANNPISRGISDAVIDEMYTATSAPGVEVRATAAFGAALPISWKQFSAGCNSNRSTSNLLIHYPGDTQSGVAPTIQIYAQAVTNSHAGGNLVYRSGFTFTLGTYGPTARFFLTCPAVATGYSLYIGADQSSLYSTNPSKGYYDWENGTGMSLFVSFANNTDFDFEIAYATLSPYFGSKVSFLLVADIDYSGGFVYPAAGTTLLTMGYPTLAILGT